MPLARQKANTIPTNWNTVHVLREYKDSGPHYFAVVLVGYILPPGPPQGEKRNAYFQSWLSDGGEGGTVVGAKNDIGDRVVGGQ
jgi:hypothetical protein